MVRDFLQIVVYVQFSPFFIRGLARQRGKTTTQAVSRTQRSPNSSVRGDRKADKKQSNRSDTAGTSAVRPRVSISDREKRAFERKEAEGAGLTSALIGVSARGAESGGMQPVSTGR